MHLLRVYDDDVAMNVGCGEDLTIRTLAEAIAEATGYQGDLVFDARKPGGTPRKLLDTNRLTATGWRPTIGLTEGIRSTHAWFIENEQRTAHAS